MILKPHTTAANTFSALCTHPSNMKCNISKRTDNIQEEGELRWRHRFVLAVLQISLVIPPKDV